MKIQKVTIKDFKIIKNLEKEINGSNILLLGDNGVGKSSFIQFIEIALGKQTEIPINAEGEGTVIADKDGRNWTFHVKFKGNKPLVTITSPEGIKDTSKSALANIVGAIDFDIDEFVNLSDTTAGRKKQVEIYKGFLPKETQDFINNQEKRVVSDYDRRTDLNRELKTLEGALAEHKFKTYLDPIPENPIDITDLQRQIDETITSNDKIKDVITRKDARAKEISDINGEVKKLQEKVIELEKSQKLAEDFIAKNPLVNISEMMTKKDSAYTTNSAIEDKKDYDKKMNQLIALKDEVGEKTAFIESSRQVIADAIKDCDVPVDGLSFDSDNLIYNEVPVSTGNLSTSEIMYLGFKLKIAQNPGFGILFIQRGESIGAQRLKDIQDMAKKYNLQIIMEQVERGKEQLTIEIMGA